MADIPGCVCLPSPWDYEGFARDLLYHGPEKGCMCGSIFCFLKPLLLLCTDTLSSLTPFINLIIIITSTTITVLLSYIFKISVLYQRSFGVRSFSLLLLGDCSLGMS